MFRQDYRINRMMVWKIENHVDPVILSENILALCLNNYKFISNLKTYSRIRYFFLAE